jgi:hypothetical protein
MDIGVGETKCTVSDATADLGIEPDPQEQAKAADASSKPTDYRNHRAPGQYTYQPLGIEMTGFAPAHYIDNEVRNLELRDNDIVIAAYPKTGEYFIHFQYA